jgi:hypothetical protein
MSGAWALTPITVELKTAIKNRLFFVFMVRCHGAQYDSFPIAR